MSFHIAATFALATFWLSMRDFCDAEEADRTLILCILIIMAGTYRLSYILAPLPLLFWIRGSDYQNHAILLYLTALPIDALCSCLVSKATKQQAPTPSHPIAFPPRPCGICNHPIHTFHNCDGQYQAAMNYCAKQGDALYNAFAFQLAQQISTRPNTLSDIWRSKKVQVQLAEGQEFFYFPQQCSGQRPSLHTKSQIVEAQYWINPQFRDFLNAALVRFSQGPQ